MLRIISTEEELNAIKAEWDGFIHKDSISDKYGAFLSYDWTALWVGSFLKGKRGRRLFAIVEYDDARNEIKSIAPFYIEKFFIIFKCLRFISDDYSDYLGILNSGGGIENILEEINFLLTAGSKADIAYLKQISKEQREEILEYEDGFRKVGSSTKHRRALGVPASKVGLNFTGKSSGDCYYINLPDSMDSYINGFNSKQRYNILKRVKNAEKKGVEYVNVSVHNRDDNNLDHYLEEFFTLHQKRWNSKGKKGVFHDDKSKYFFKKLFTVLYHNGILSLSFLKYDEKPVAASVCFDVGDKRQVYLPGFSPEYSFLHPGIVLTYYNIKEAILLNYKEFDFLKGPEDYKKRFLGKKRENYKIYLYKTTFIYWMFKLNLFLKNELFPKIKNIFTA